MNSKFIFVALLACLATSYALSQGVGERVECLHKSRLAQGRLFESKIKEAFEKVRELLKKGINGIGPLDPLDISNKHVNINNQYVNLDANLTAKSTGLAGFVLSDVSLSIFLKLKFALTFPKVTAKGDYSLDLSSPLIDQKVFGKVTFDTNFEGFTVKGEGKVSTKLNNGKLVVQINSLTVDPSLQDASVAVTGLMNDEQLSSEISDKLTNELPKIIKDNKDRINKVVGQVIPYINKYLAGNGIYYEADSISC